MDYRTYHLAELLPQALHDLATLSGAAPGRSEDRPPQSHPALRVAARPARKHPAAPAEPHVRPD